MNSSVATAKNSASSSAPYGSRNVLSPCSIATAQRVVRGGQVRVPRFQRSRAAGRVTRPRCGQPATFRIQIVCAFVQHDVEAVRRIGGRGRDVVPGQDDPVRIPGLARQFTAAPGDEAIVVLDLVLDPERARIHEDRPQFVVEAAGTPEQQQARLAGDGGADLVGDLEPVAADEVLLREKSVDESFEPGRLRSRQHACSTHVPRERCTQRGFERFRQQAPPAPPAQPGRQQQHCERRTPGCQDGSDRGRHADSAVGLLQAVDEFHVRLHRLLCASALEPGPRVVLRPVDE